MPTTRMLFIPLVVWLGLAPSTAWSDPESAESTRHLTLKEAVLLAVENSPELKRLRTNAEVFRLEEKNAFARLLPTLDLTSKVGRNERDPQVTPNPWASETVLSLGANLYRNNQDWLRYKIAQSRREIADIDYERLRNRLAYEIAREVYNYSRLKLAEDIARQRFTIIQAQFRIVQRQFEAGEKPREDYLRFKGELQKVELELIGFRNDYTRVLEVLTALVGIQSEQRSLVQLELEPLYVTTNERIPDPPARPSVRRHYDYRRAEANREVQEFTRQLARNALLPEIFANVDWKQNQNNYVGSGPRDSFNEFSAMIEFRYNLWDGGLRRRQVEIEKQKLVITEAQMEQALLVTRRDINVLIHNSDRFRRELSVNKDLLGINESLYQKIEREYRLGNASYLDYINALNELLVSRTGFQRSYFNYLDTLTELEFHEGTLYDRLTKK